MRAWAWVGTLAAALMLSGTASAAECEAGKDGVKLSRLGSGNFAMDIMLGTMLSDPMKAGSVKSSEVKKLPKTCDRGDFLAGKGRYRAYGEAPGKKGAPIRYAVREDGKGPIAYLVQAGDEADGYWILVTTDGDEMVAYAKVSAVPNDNDLRIILAGALDGRYPRKIGLDLKTGGITQYVNVDELKEKDDKTAPKSSPEMPKPPPGQGAPGEPQVLSAPDGAIFKAVEGDGWAHGATGFVCPAAVNGYRRGKAIIFDAAENGRDVACQLVGKNSWMTIYLTKLPDDYSPAEVFSTYSEQARATVASKKDIEPPWMLPKSRNPSYADFWVGPKDEREGMWVTAIGPWYVKMRVTYFPDEEGELVELAAAIAKQISEQVKPPEI
jgi:hypothetical protein